MVFFLGAFYGMERGQERHNGGSSIPVVPGLCRGRSPLVQICSGPLPKPGREHATDAPDPRWAARVNATVGGTAYSHNLTLAWTSRDSFGSVGTFCYGLRP